MPVLTTSHTGRIGHNRTGFEEAEVRGAQVAVTYFFDKRPGLTGPSIRSAAENLFTFWTLHHSDPTLYHFACGFRDMAYTISKTRR